jgi:HAD superfamily hydrolase (TIGR01509 family)
MLPKAIIFDFDGILCDSQSLHKECLKESLTYHGYGWNPDMQKIYNKHFNLKTKIKLQMLAERGLITTNDINRIQLKKQDLTLQKIKNLKLAPHVFEDITKLHALTKLGIASDCNKETIFEFLKKNSLNHLFSSIVTSESCKQKPHPDVYINCLNELNVSPKEVVVFDDSLIGIDAAISAGINKAIICTYNSLHNSLENILSKFDQKN